MAETPQPQIETAVPTTEAPKYLRTKIAAAMLATCALIGACAGNDSEPVATEATIAAEEDVETTTTIQTEEGEFTIPGGFADGADEAVEADDNRGLFECGPKERGIGEDGTYSANTYLDYMAENKALAQEVERFNIEGWNGKYGMGQAAYDLLAEKGASNPLTTSEIEDDELAGFSDLSSKLVASRSVPDGTVSLNFECKDGIDPYDVRTLHTDETTLLGVALKEDDYEEWVGLVEESDNNPDDFIVYDIEADTNDDKEPEVLKFVVLYHGMCKNPQRTVPPNITPPTTEKAPPTTGGTTPTTRGGGTTTTTRGGGTTTTTKPVEGKVAEPPVEGGPSTTVEAPEPGPSYPTTSTTKPKPTPSTNPPSTVPNTTNTTEAPTETVPRR